MKNFELISTVVNPDEALAQILAQPDLWNGRPERRHGQSPHRETSDIWVRWRDPGVGQSFGPGPMIHWPAWYRVPALTGIVWPIVHACAALELGGILITKIPAGCQVYPHDDRGGWHAERYNCKVYVPLQAPPECVNWCDGEDLVMRSGEAWRFNNLLPHSVVNSSPDMDRITLIICMRAEE